MTRETLFMKAINEGLDQAMERDERVVLLGEDIAGGVNVEHLEIITRMPGAVSWVSHED